MKRRAPKDRGLVLAKLWVTVELYDEGSPTISIGRRPAKKRTPGPPVELMAALEAYARKVYKSELVDRKRFLARVAREAAQAEKAAAAAGMVAP